MDRRSERAGPSVAVALRYEIGRDAVPVVVAKGHGHVADRIVEIAEANGIAVEEDAALAASLVQLPTDARITPELYAAVATVVRFVLRRSAPLTLAKAAAVAAGTAAAPGLSAPGQGVDPQPEPRPRAGSL